MFGTRGRKFMKFRLRAVFAAVALSAAVAPSAAVPAFAQQSVRTDPIAGIAVNVFMTNYYQNPQSTNVLGILKSIEQSGATKNPNALPPMFGFMAGLFIKYPDKIASFIPKDASSDIQLIVLNGLMLAGRRAELLEQGKTWGLDPQKLGALVSGRKPLLQINAANATDFDMCWGASFATGDARFVRKIYDAYVRYVENPWVDVNDVVTLADLVSRRGDAQAMRQLMDRYQGAQKGIVITAAAALWGLKSNANQHAFVAAFMKRMAAEKKSAKAVSGWVSFAKM
jgi:hypothetical protein